VAVLPRARGAAHPLVGRVGERSVCQPNGRRLCRRERVEQRELAKQR
jgi:hypothetical protein